MIKINIIKNKKEKTEKIQIKEINMIAAIFILMLPIVMLADFLLG